MSVGLKFFANGTQYMLIDAYRKPAAPKKKPRPFAEKDPVAEPKNAMGEWLEARRAPRKGCSVFVDFSASSRVFQEKITDISISGAFIETRAGLGIGDEISMIISVPGKPVRMMARVARKTSSGIGVEFRNRLNFGPLAAS